MAMPNNIERPILKRTHSDIPGDLERKRTIILPHEMTQDFDPASLPQLGDRRIRHSEQGKLYIDKYHGMDIQVALPNITANAEIRFDQVDVSKKLWPELDDVESAIRYTRHIADSYDKRTGQETVSLLTINRAIKFIGQELQKKGAERMSWNEIALYGAQEIVRSGFDAARSREKVDMVNFLMRALQKDSINRENPSRTRWMLAHLYKPITMRLMTNEHIFNKYRHLESVLYSERARDRFPFEVFCEDVEELVAMGERNREAEFLEEKIKLDALTELAPSKIRTAPYVQMAAEIRYGLAGRNTEEDIRKLRKYLPEEKVEVIISQPTYYDLKFIPEGRKNRLMHMAIKAQDQLLVADENLLIRDEQEAA